MPKSENAKKTNKSNNDSKNFVDNETSNKRVPITENKIPNNKKKKNVDDDISEKSQINFFENPEDGLPEFLREENLRDKSGRKVDHPEYDSSTLLVPQEFLKKTTPGMQQYWNIKKDNFDKVIFFKLGKFYEMFFDDAIVGNKVLDLNWMGNDPKKLHVGFPEKVLEEKAYLLIQSGFKVAVIEQVETPEEMVQRSKANSTKCEKVVRRELCNVLTKGTFIHESQKFENKNNYNNKFCLVLISKKHNDENETLKYDWFFILFDITTLNFFLGKILKDDENFHKIKTLIYNVNPHEVIISKNNIDDYILHFLNSLSSMPLITTLKNEYSVLSLYKITTKYLGEDSNLWNKILLKYISNQNEETLMCSAIYLMIVYLEKILLAENCLKIANFEDYSSNIILSKNLILDYQSVSNLEILETKYDPKNIESGSLLEYLNKASSPFGCRLMKTWILNPLSKREEIEKRLNMVDDIMENYDCIKIFRDLAGKWPDIERQITKIYKFSMQTNSKAIYFEDFSKTRIAEFFKVINFFKNSTKCFEIFSEHKNKFKSFDLKKKVTLEDDFIDYNSEEKGNVINIKKIMEEFESFYIETKDDAGEIRIKPRKGIHEPYDILFEKIEELKLKFEEILREEKKNFKSPFINFAHTKNYKYELEIPEDLLKTKNIGSKYKLTTSRKGFLRYHTDEILDLVTELEEYQENLKKENNKFNILLFQKFYSKNLDINTYINGLAELDCLFSLAFTSSQVKIIFYILIGINNGQAEIYRSL